MDFGPLTEQLKGYPGVLAWYLLGSAARGALRPDSDIDLAALPMPQVSLDRTALVAWGGELSLVVGRDIDIGVLDQSNLVYAKEALVSGRCLWSADPHLSVRRSAELLALYLKFQEDRKEVLDAYRA